MAKQTEDLPSVESLGTSTPSVQQVDAWMRQRGLTPHVIGQSLLGQNLVVYELILPGAGAATSNNHNHPQATKESSSTEETIPTILFLSLLHGNEPMGLLALLWTVQLLQETQDQQHATTSLPTTTTTTRILFFPMVNVDAYQYNLQNHNECRRTNMRKVCQRTNNQCLEQDGVDLNRNFAFDFAPRNSNKCSQGYPGREPFSEPETQAIRRLVTKKRFGSSIGASMSFHTRANGSRPRRYYYFVHCGYERSWSELLVRACSQSM